MSINEWMKKKQRIEMCSYKTLKNKRPFTLKYPLYVKKTVCVCVCILEHLKWKGK